MNRRRVCWSVDAQTLEDFERVCKASNLPYSHVIDELMAYFVRIETAAATIPVDQPQQQERQT